ncbi:MAG: NAD(P)-dependent glycerol-3-phosphate dehydrogenase [Verrucomicrobia bacterium]|nr:NAD(P)-dependent glycerol-3-phosphate dehydrogenase [Verrucomicrobiota bacterium]
MNLAIAGAGAWGTALGLVLHQNRHHITLWDADGPHLDRLRSTRRNERYLPGVELPADWTIEPDWGRAVPGQEAIVFALPSVAFRQVAARLDNPPALLVSVTKGIEHDSGATMCRILREYAPRGRIAALSGPSFAFEVARGMPTAIVAASTDAAVAHAVQELFHRPTFRVYTSPDPTGVELGGALKNIMAIAAGISDGLGFGDNSKAALVTRAIAEMRRLGVACGAQPETFSGLSGLGDLALTCFSRLSRNRELGERLGRGENLAAIMAAGHKLAEGHPTTRSAFRLARTRSVATPIIDEVYATLYEGKEVRQSLTDLLARESKAED